MIQVFRALGLASLICLALVIIVFISPGIDDD